MFGLLKNMLRNIVVEILDELFENTESPVLGVQRLYEDAILPWKGSTDAAGYDLHAHSYAFMEDGTIGDTVKLDDEHVLVIPANSRCLVKTGVAVSVPDRCYGRVAPRSGLALKGINVGAGVIDKDYTGEVGVILFNINSEPFQIKKDDRIAQFICEQIVYPEICEIERITATDRGTHGFGSTD